MGNARDLLRAGLAALLLVWPGTAGAKLRASRLIDWRSGLPVSFTGNVEQDPQGFLWVTSSAGVFRYDGAEMVPKLPLGLQLVTGSATAGHPLTLRQLDEAVEIRELDGTVVTGPQGRALRPSWAHMTRDGALWTIERTGTRRRSPEGVWGAPVPFPEADTTSVGPGSGRGGSLLVHGKQAVYRIDPSGRSSIVARLHGALQALDRADGSTAIGTFVAGRGFVYEVRDGTLREIDRYPTRFMALAERRGVLWICYDSALVRLAAGEPRDSITFEDGLPSGGALLVDHEGSLWVATFRGLAQFPEPDTASWVTEIPVLGRHLVLDGGIVWMSAWTGLYRAQLDATGETVAREPHGHVAAPCLDPSGRVWTVTPGGFASVARDGRARVIPVAGLLDAEPCAVSPAGDLWFPTQRGLYLLLAGADVPRAIEPADPARGPFRFVFQDSRGRLWGTRDGEVCSTRANDLAEGHATGWSCTAAPHREPQSFLEMDSGDLWAATFDAGLWRYREGLWEEIPASRELPTRWASSLSRSPRGGVWIAGEGNFLRVRERTDLPGGWEVLERVGLWQGMPTSGVLGVVETEDGTLWAATNLSLVRVPPAARRARPDPPPVVLVEAAVDGRPLDLASGRGLRLPYRRNRLELRFAALSFREPSLIRYRSRLRADDPWSPPTRQPFFRFVDLPPRRYRVEVEASLDGERWSATRAGVSFEILRPWWGTWWFRLLAATTVGAVLLLAYRLRVASLLKVERQRMRIAMDLHDEVGSGLGSIGVLAGILGRPELPPVQRTELSDRIGGVARELSQSLGDIVWSLRTGSGNLDALWLKILDRARPLFAGGSTALQVVAPDPVPATPLSLVVRRNASLIAIEALHNAARHAAASSVSLTLRPQGEGWIVTIEDDGNGLRDLPGDTTRRGLGLTGMRLRAEEMGGSVVWETPEGGGTRVVLRFRAGRE